MRWLLRIGVTIALAIWAAPSSPAENASRFVILDVPYVPTPPEVMEAMLAVANVGKDDVLYDLGSGDGRIAIAAVRERGAKRAVGIDLNAQRIAEANANAGSAGVTDRVTFIHGDIFDEDFSAATVVTMYLLDNVNLRLRPRILNLKPGTRIVSHQFHMFDWPPDEIINVFEKVPVYYWMVPAKIEGKWTRDLDGQSVTLDLRQKFQTVSGTLAIGSTLGIVTDAKMTGAQLTLDGHVARDGNGGTVRFEGTADGNQLTGVLTVGDVTRDVVLQRVAF